MAEDSFKMFLKVLYLLLEDGCIEDDFVFYKKVGFIGIFNWVLDFVKMNRGIFVLRGSFNKKEFIESVKGICFLEFFVRERI